jgi:hypothetical protein
MNAIRMHSVCLDSRTPMSCLSECVLLLEFVLLLECMQSARLSDEQIVYVNQCSVWVCLCVCVRAYVCACVRVCVRVCVFF